MPQASSLEAAIKRKYGITSRLKEGVGGIFEVAIDGKTVYSNQATYRFPTDEEIFEKIDAATTT
ncbi:MAG TPA: Rdx family protein [Methylomirabilota bacterium]|nr:Rdx family protein [Methylomirabilota bacterium]